MKKLLTHASALAFATALALTLTLAAPPAIAYTDTTDPALTRAADVLTGLGILSGYGDGSLQPTAALTRAEFSKLAILAEGHGDKASAASYKTLFSDVPATSWAAPYINLAYEEGLMGGYGNGKFGPDDPVTVGQAAAVLLTLLGYAQEDVGPFWPEDYMEKAAGLGLLDGVTHSATETLTRGDAALMLSALMTQTTKEGKDYAATLATTTEEGVVLLSVDAEADDGTLHTAKVYGSGGLKYYEQSAELPQGLEGLRGTLLLDKSGKVSGFVPDGGTSKTLTDVTATADGLKDTAGNSYAVPSAAAVVLDDGKTTYGESWYDLDGRDVTLYYTPAGAISLLAAGESDAFEGVTLTGYYESATPNAKNPTTVTLFGAAFPVADGAASSLSQFKVGERMTVVLNGAGEVAKAYPTTEKRADVLGVLESSNTEQAQITLVSGLSVTGTLTNSSTAASKLVGCLVKVTSSGVGKLTVSGLTGRETSSDLNVAAKTLGSLPLADNVTIYERVGESTVTELELDDILLATVPAAQIEYYLTNDAGQVSLLLLQDATGDAYTYGVLHASTQTGGTDDMSYTNNTVAVENSAGTSTAYITGQTVKDSILGGVAGSGEGKAQGIVTLTKVAGVTRAAFDGTDYVVLDGVRVPIAENVQVYNQDSGQWMTLTEAKAYTEGFTVYYSGKLETTAKARVIYTD